VLLGGRPPGIGIRISLFFARTSLMRAASFAASQPARRWADGKKILCFPQREVKRLARYVT